MGMARTRSEYVLPGRRCVLVKLPRLVLGILIVTSCSSPTSVEPSPAPTPRPSPIVAAAPAPAATRLAPVPVDAPAPFTGTVLQATAMIGPSPTLLEACKSTAPCGTTVYEEPLKFSKPPLHADCRAVADPATDPNGSEPNGQGARLVHPTADGEIRLASATCAVPEGIRYDENRYYVFVKRADGWWRTSTPLFTFYYNNKYCGGTLVARWNDRPGRTFLGLAATLGCLTCMKQGHGDETIEMMIRVETGGATPIAFPPLVVGERSVNTPDNPSPDVECKASKRYLEMSETWPSDDDLVLTGPATWHAIARGDGGIAIGLGLPGEVSTAGTYRFAR